MDLGCEGPSQIKREHRLFNKSLTFLKYPTAEKRPEPPPEQRNPCLPSPCGPNSQCTVQDQTYSCSCLANYIGTPPNCRPECISNNECSLNLACIAQRCSDPCPGSCGLNAECHVAVHIPNCVCLQNYVGDPFRSCTLKQSKYSTNTRIKRYWH